MREKECFKLIFKNGRIKHFNQYYDMLNYILTVKDEDISSIIDIKAKLDITDFVLDREEEKNKKRIVNDV